MCQAILRAERRDREKHYHGQPAPDTRRDCQRLHLLRQISVLKSPLRRRMQTRTRTVVGRPPDHPRIVPLTADNCPCASDLELGDEADERIDLPKLHIDFKHRRRII